METRPPAVIERIVRVLVPPVAREHVMGDLSERYVSPSQYLADAFRTVPFVIASRVRRTSHPVALAFMAMFFWFGAFHGPMQSSWVVATLPTLAGLIAIILRAAYRVPGFVRWSEAALDVAVFAAAVAACEGAVALIDPGLLLNKSALLAGFPFSCALMFFMRLQMPGGEPLTPAAARSISLEALTSEVRTLERAGRRAVRIEIGACVVVAILFGVMAVIASDTLQKVGHALITLGAVFVGVFLFRLARRGRPMPEGLDFAQSIEHYRARLQLSRNLSRTYALWYVLPLALGPVVMSVGQVLRGDKPSRAMGALLFIVAFAGLLVWLHALMARGLQKRLEQLAVTQEKVS